MINVRNDGPDLFVIQIEMNELHTLDIPELKDRLNNAIKEERIKKLVLDLSSVEIITSTGIGIFLSINRTLSSNFCLACLNTEVRKVLEMTKVNSMIKMCDTVDDAVKKLG